MAYLAATQRRRIRRPGGLGDLGLQIGPKIRVGGSVGRVAQNAKTAVTKAAVDTGHTVGKVASSKIGVGVTAGLLALTGVGAPAAAAILGTQKGVGNLIKKGGNLKSGFTGAYQGAAVGAAAALAPSIVRGAKSGATSIVSRIRQQMAPKPEVATETPNMGRLPKPGEPGYPKTRRRITNGDATAVIDAKNRGRKKDKSGGVLEQLLAQLAPSATTSAPPVYTAPVQDGPVPSDAPIQQASLFGNPLLLAGGAIVLVMLAKSSRAQ